MTNIEKEYPLLAVPAPLVLYRLTEGVLRDISRIRVPYEDITPRTPRFDGVSAVTKHENCPRHHDCLRDDSKGDAERIFHFDETEIRTIWPPYVTTATGVLQWATPPSVVRGFIRGCV